MTETEILFDLLEKGISPAHAVSACEKRLTDAGFEVIDYGTAWNLKAGGKYVINHHETTLFAFTLPQNWSDREPAIRIAAAHTDFPCLRIKPSCDIQTNGYAQVNVEVYGGAILNTWLDRPLGVAGRVAVRSGDVFTPKVVTFQSEKNLMTIPNLAIHMNREVNKGVELNKQTELLPICGLSDDADYFLDFLVKELAVKKEDILDFELTIYNKEKPEFVGLNEDYQTKSPFDLSGGQKRRVAIAGIMAMRPEILILDEPAAGLDPRGREEILREIAEYRRQTGATIVLVSHSMEDVAQYAESILVMNAGKIFCYDTVSNVFRRSQELQAIGLSVPQITRVCTALRAHGVPLSEDIYTVEEAKRQLLALLRKKEAQETC